MNKTIFSVLLALIVLMVGVSAYRLSDNYSVNQSMVGWYDSFSNNSGYFDYPSNMSWTPDQINLTDGVAKFYIPYSNLGFSMLHSLSTGTYAYYPNNETWTTEFDMRANYTTLTSYFGIKIGNSEGQGYVVSPYLQVQWLESGIICEGTTNQAENISFDTDWHHYKIVARIQDFQYDVYRDNVSICPNVGYYSGFGANYPNNPILDNSHFFVGDGVNEFATYEVDDYVAYKGTDSPYYMTNPPNSVDLWDSFDNRNTTAPDLGAAMKPDTSNWSLSGYGYGYNPGVFEVRVVDGVMLINSTSDSFGAGTGITPLIAFTPTTSDNYTYEWDFKRVAGSAHGNMYVTSAGVITGYIQVGDNGSVYCVDFVNSYPPMLDVNDGNWHHFQMLLDNANSKFAVYENDALICGNVSFGNVGSVDLAGTGWISVVGTSEGAYYTETLYDNITAYAGFPAQFGGNQSCTPNWNCSSFDTCSANVTQCLAVTDLNTCGQPFLGNLSDYNGICCSPDWVCSGYVVGCTNSSRACNAVTDNNVCGGSYGGNYSEFTPLACSVSPTGYAAQYGSGDLTKIVVDFFGTAGNEVAQSIGLIVIVVLVGFGVAKITTMKKKLR